MINVKKMLHMCLYTLHEQIKYVFFLLKMRRRWRQPTEMRETSGEYLNRAILCESSFVRKSRLATVIWSIFVVSNVSQMVTHAH